MPESNISRELVFTYGEIIQILNEMERKNFSDWRQNLDLKYLEKLEQPLLVRSKNNSSKLDINFER